MGAQNAPAQLSDLEFLGAYDEYMKLRGTSGIESLPEFEQTSRAVKRRIFEAMMVNWAFGGPIKSSMTPAVSAGLGLLVSRSPYGGLVGTAVGAGVSCLGPMYTKWHLSSYAEKHPDVTLHSMAGCWKQLHAGQGDARAVRLERVRPSLDSVPNGLRRLIGILFVSIQSSASLRRLFSDVYTDSLTASPALQGTVHTGKDILQKERDREHLAQQDELARLRRTVEEQDAMLRRMQEDRAYEGDSANVTDGRLSQVEQTLARVVHSLGPLLETLGEADSTEVQVVQVKIHTKRVVGVEPVDPRRTAQSATTKA
jgi:hypothetical protein